ncbi:2-dehydro-3-deoxygalactonokinase [Borborobacter arsenicus]|uniref:2-dehydro-3-deoxygalactonokinase n=1 Tax=Borborobacter arsenicus TaxID=1851146 RepID=UPI00247ADCCB|nr:2-dehydro-3-deoxygalactonokinase [Pseudaminobacter arsenicus]
MFALRASQLLGASDRADGASSLSGLLVGAEVGAARRLYPAGRDVTLVASGPIAGLYRAALEQGGFTVRLHDAEEATRQGLMAAARQIWQKGNDQ